MIIVLSSLIGVVILTDISLMVCWVYFERGNRKKTADSDLENWPKVSILLAVRNEEENIQRCFTSLMALDYQKDKIEILIGDDNSTDSTYELVERLIANHPNCHLFKIDDETSHQKAKAKVLGQLAQKASGQYYFVTDADMRLPESWIKEMVITAESGIDIITGVTLVEDNKWQSIDWLFAIAMIYVLDCLGKPVTAMGNNMMISRRAYKAVGGYEKIPFSITEDMELFRHARKEGFKVKHIFNYSVLGFTKSIKEVSSLFHQRKRWMHGALQLKWPMITILVIQAFYFPLIISAFIISPIIALGLFIVKTMIQALFIHFSARTLKHKVSVIHLFLYEFYSWFVSIGSGLFYLSGSKVIWKGRKY
ncbi:glycosyltransferase [Fulvivirga lutimaris]|uniref:glycosyltransferase n=1 Tax=Fulvivirga lutimaris TaxID=1819566 RepID=UPI0012BC6DB5|nr:glycosyltransferase [Fulvivirga lutimaris]MTI38559.1 glycosyltransferase [Fulvivirga lutimaris]